MPSKQKPPRGVRILTKGQTTLLLNEAQMLGLNDLLATGMYGNTIPQIILRVIDEKLLGMKYTVHPFRA